MNIHRLSTSVQIRKQVIDLIISIQKDEYLLPETEEIHALLRAEEDFYYHNALNFWYATNETGEVIGSIALRKLDDKTGEIKKFFVHSHYRGICFAVGRENTVSHLAGSAVAFVNLLIMAGGLIAQPLVGKLLDYFWSGELMTDGIRAYSAGDFKAAMIVLPIGCLMTLICLFFMRETHAEMRA